jgi:dTDP-4-amino-4,6-dideoxygalactose transaminase
MINVTKPSLPDFEQYTEYLRGIWERNHFTNRGPLALELEDKLKKHLGVNHLLFVANGTIALQIAIRALELSGEILTTPFSYVATTTSILWENCKPVFVDIEKDTFCIDPDLIESKITEQTTAILATHVYGFPCDVWKIEKIARKHNLKVIYDAAHAFGVRINGKSILSFGDISTLSFHATKLFHTVEGGSITCNIPELEERIFHYHAFGHMGDQYFTFGVNGKNSEVHAAMGLCNLGEVKNFVEQRKIIAESYRLQLSAVPVSFPGIIEAPDVKIDYNYAYLPVVFRNEQELLKVKVALESKGVNTRRYFYPSLNNLPYLDLRQTCPVSEEISKRVLCLPFYQQLTPAEINQICSVIKSVF